MIIKSKQLEEYVEEKDDETKLIESAFTQNMSFKSTAKNYKYFYRGQYNIMPDADVKFFLTASIKVRALRRTKELRKNGFNVSINEVYKSIKNRDKSDYSRSVAPLKITKDAIKINTTNLTIRKTFLILKDKIDKKIIL